MSNRAWGAVLLTLVLFGAVLIPVVTGRRIAGSAARVAVREPPQLGECLQASSGSGWSGFDFSAVQVLTAPVGPCGDANYGEVVAVSEDSRMFPSSLSARGPYPEPLACQRPARTYLGWSIGASLTASDRQPADTEGALARWHPVVTDSLALLGPDVPQFLDGQRWIACVMLPRAGPYPGSVRRGASAAPAAADAYGTCTDDSASAFPVETPCAQPHDGETFGWAPVGVTSEPSLLGSCKVLLASATGRSSILNSGEVAVTLTIGYAVGGVPEVRHDREQRATCSVVAKDGRTLGGSLIGIGDGPLPWR